MITKFNLFENKDIRILKFKNEIAPDKDVDPYGEDVWQEERDRHYECCPKHGCKFKEPDCPVANKKAVPIWWIKSGYTNPCKYCYGEEWR